MERWAREAGDPRLRARHHRPGQSQSSCRPTSAIATFDQDGTLWVEHPMYTQLIYCLDRVPAVVKAKAGADEGRAVQDRAVRQPGGDREASDAGPEEDRRRDADRHDGGRVQCAGEGVAGHGQASALEAALHRAHLPADAGGAAIPARQWLQDLHRHRRRAGFCARLCRAGLRHPARAGGRQRRRDDIRL